VNASAENDPVPRRFNVGDGLILVGSFALSMSLLRSGDWFERIPGRINFWANVVSGLTGASQWQFYQMSRAEAVRMVVAQAVDEVLVELLGSILLGLTLVQPLMRLRSPRPRIRELIRQSGFVVCFAVIVGALAFVDFWTLANVAGSPGLIPGAVLLLLWPLVGLPPWKAERSWIDRLGRGVGWGWIVATASVTALGYL
jgi:hypothetical protein